MVHVEEVFDDLKKSIAAGLILIVPIASVLLVAQWLIERILPLIDWRFVQVTNIEIANQLIGLFVLTTISLFVVILSGYFGRSFIGKKVEKKVDGLFESIPLLGKVYDIVKHTSQDLLKENSFKESVKIQTGDLRRTAFRTGNKTGDGREILFMPTSPNITSGYVVEVEPENIEETNESVDEALERLLSAGFGNKKNKKQV